jgi:hypothetical protein
VKGLGTNSKEVVEAFLSRFKKPETVTGISCVFATIAIVNVRLSTGFRKA